MRTCNLDQLHSLCQALHRDYGLETTALEFDALNFNEKEARSLLQRTDILHANTTAMAAQMAGMPSIVPSAKNP